MKLDRRIKKAATSAFRDNPMLAEVSTEDREEAARFYERVAGEVVGTRAELARRRNLERAGFLRGEVERIAVDANLFAMEVGESDV